MIPAGKREAVIGALDDEGIDYVVADETSGREYAAVVTFPLPTAAVEPVLAELRAVGIDERTYTVIVNAETVISRRFEELEEKYAAESDRGEDHISQAELRARAQELAPSLPTYVMMTIVSAVIATAGLLLDSPATVVGSMVIAPLIGPAMSTSVGTVVDDKEMFRRGAWMQVLGLLLSIASAAVFATFLRATHLVPPGLDPLAFAEVSERLAPNVLVLVVALGAGVAGVVSLVTGVSTALVGVMIAVALIPPAAAVGIGMAFRIPRLALGAGVLVLVNVLSINLAALLVLWYEGYRPTGLFAAESARSALIKRAIVLVAAIAVLSVFLGGVTYDSYTAATTEQEIRAVTVDELEQTDASLRLLGLEVQRSGTLPSLRTEEVIISVGYPPGSERPQLLDRLEARIEEQVGHDVTVELRLVSVERVERADETG